MSNVRQLRPTPDRDTYSFPELVLDEETGLFDVVFEGCVVFPKLDVIGECEKIRIGAGGSPSESDPHE